MAIDLAILNEVQGALAAGATERRGEMLRHVADLFVFGAAGYSDDEIALFDDVLLRLIVDIELSARALLAVRLAPIANAPAGTIRKLAFDLAGEVADPVLRRSPQLDDATLVDIAGQMGQRHLLAISQRAMLSEIVTDALLEHGDRHVAFSLAGNPGARFSQSGFADLVDRSQYDESLATLVGARPEIPPHLFDKLLSRASATVRAKLEREHPEARREVGEVVDEVAARIRAEHFEQSPQYLAAHSIVGELADDGTLDDARLGALARSGLFEETTAALALMSELPIAFIKAAMREEQPEKIVIIARVIGTSWETLKAVLLLRAAKGGLSRHELEEYRTRFQKLKAVSANEIVRFYRMNALLNPKKH